LREAPERTGAIGRFRAAAAGGGAAGAPAATPAVFGASWPEAYSPPALRPLGPAEAGLARGTKVAGKRTAPGCRANHAVGAGLPRGTKTKGTTSLSEKFGGVADPAPADEEEVSSAGIGDPEQSSASALAHHGPARQSKFNARQARYSSASARNRRKLRTLNGSIST
jgi:hypothetical protein